MSNKEKTGFGKVAAGFYKMHPEEAPLMVRKKGRVPVSLGVPKELAPQENRVSLRPEAVSVLVNNGFDIFVESKAGLASKHSDNDYAEAGATVAYATEEVFKADVILKIAPPTVAEIGYMKNGKAVISALPVSALSAEYLKALNRKQITALAYEFIEDKVGGLPLVRAMSEIAGSTAMLIAAEYLSSRNDGKGIILGGVTGVPPTKVVIIGAGTVAEYTARAAIGLGAEVKVFDNHIYKLRRIKEQLGQHHIYTSTIDGVMLLDSLIRADVVVGAVRADEGTSPCVVTEEMVSRMKPNTVIIDVSIDQGGCFETSEVTTQTNPVFRKYGVIHYCVPNIASYVARTATTAISNIFTPMLIKLMDAGGIDQMMYAHQWFAKGAYTYKGGVTNKAIADKLSMPYKALELIMAANI